MNLLNLPRTAAATLGESKVLLKMRNFNCEELGMKAMARWLPEIIQQPLPITFLPAQDLYYYLLCPEARLFIPLSLIFSGIRLPNRTGKAYN